MEIQTNKEPIVLGEFKTRYKFITFTSFVGHMRIDSKEAIIEGSKLSGLGMENISFRLKICDEGTVSFDEVNSVENTLSKEQRERLLEVIYDKTISPYDGKMIIKDLVFKSVYKINDKYASMYLSVEKDTPIERLSSIFSDMDDDEVSEQDLSTSTISNSQLSKINSLFSDDVNEGNDTFSDNTKQDTIVESENDSYIEKIKKSNQLIIENKVIELNDRLLDKQKDYAKIKREYDSCFKKLTEVDDDIKLILDRIESITPSEDPNGYYFNVSEKIGSKTQLSDEVITFLRNKLSLVKSINTDAFIKLLEDGIFEIRIGEKIGDDIVIIDDISNFKYLDKFNKMDINIDNGKLIYNGKLSWGNLVNKISKLGFSQDPSFNKTCGSNSYNINTITTIQ